MLCTFCTDSWAPVRGEGVTPRGFPAQTPVSAFGLVKPGSCCKSEVLAHLRHSGDLATTLAGPAILANTDLTPGNPSPCGGLDQGWCIRDIPDALPAYSRKRIIARALGAWLLIGQRSPSIRGMLLAAAQSSLFQNSFSVHRRTSLKNGRCVAGRIKRS